MRVRLAVISTVFVLLACAKEDPSGVPPSVVVVDDSAGLLVNPAIPSPDGTRLAWTQVVEGRSNVFVSALDGSGAVRLTRGVWDRNPIWSPDGKWIAYMNEDPDFDVFIVPVDGSSPPRQLTSGPAVDIPSTFLRDGTGVLFNRTGVGDEHPMVVPVAGGTPQRVGPVMEGNLHAVWSPDGALLGFDIHKGGQNIIWVQDSAAGSAPRQLTTEGFENGPTTMWAPDGKQIVYVSRRTGTADIWTMDVTTGEARQITNDVRDDASPRWSPDGRWIVFTSDRGGQDDLWMVPATGGNAVRLTNDAAPESAPLWATDGKSIYYSRTAMSVELQVIPLTGEAPTTVRSWQEQQLGSVHLSPDGKTAIFDLRSGAESEIFSLSLTGGEPTPVAPHPRSDNTARYSPDGSQIAFLSNRGGTTDIWVVPTAGGEPRNVTNAPGNEIEPLWSPDGTRIAFSSNRDVGGGDAWVINAAGGEPLRLTNQNYRPGAVQWSPDGKHLYFTGERAGGAGREYYRVPASGGRVEALGAKQTIGFARLSRDGTRVAYSSAERGWSFLDLMPLGGGPTQRLTKETENIYQAGAYWSLGDSLLVVGALDLASNRDAPELWTYRLADQQWRRLTNTKFGAELPWAFTPDATSILATVLTPRTRYLRVSVADLVKQ